VGYSDKNRNVRPAESACPSCSDAADAKAKAEILQPVTSGDLSPNPEGETKPQSQPAQHEMAHHPRCGLCGILMGPGHIEVGPAPFCATCEHRHTTDVPLRSGAAQALEGRRGWFSDHVARQRQ